MLRFETHIRDPIHGFIGITKKEKALLDTPAMQRLRNIRQLAMAHLVYPGCNHSRFEHSLGVMHIAGKIVDAIENEIREKRVNEVVLDGLKPDTLRRRVRYAALLHDIGHPPFCHVTEPILKLCSKSAFKTNELEKLHEKITCAIINLDPFIPEILGADKEPVIEILSDSSNKYRFLAKEIITGPLDADKQDYLLRDSHYSGVKYGVFDKDKLIETLTPIKDGRHVYLACKEEGICVVEQFIVAKYFISEQVYFHKVRIACDDMIVRSLRLATEVDSANCKLIKDIFKFKNNKSFISNYLSWDDHKLHNYCSGIPGNIGKLFRRLRERRLLKLRLNFDLKNLSPGPQSEFAAMKIEDEKSRIMAQEIARKFERHKDFVCVTVAKARFPKIIDQLYKVGTEDIMVMDTDSGGAVKLIDKSTALRGIPEPPMRLQVVIDDDKIKKARLNGKELEKGLKEYIAEYGS